MENVGLFIAAKAPRSGLLPATVRPPALSELPREQTLHLLLLHTTQLQAGKVFVIQLCLMLCNPMDGSLCPWNSPGKNTGVGCHSLLPDPGIAFQADSLSSEPVNLKYV